MNAHAVLEERIKSLEAILRRKRERQRLYLLPSLTSAMERSARQALILQIKINLVQKVFNQTPVCSVEDYRPQLQKPLVNLKSPEEVFVKREDELEALRGEIEAIEGPIRALIDQIDRQFADFEAHIQKEMDTIRALIKIPDLISDDQEIRQVAGVLDGMDRVLELARETKRLVEPQTRKKLRIEWSQLDVLFNEIRQRLSFDTLQEDYGFSDETIFVIEHLVSGQPLSLDQLTPDIIGELQRFQQFCRQIVLRLTVQV
jgi:hypothetical protein